MNELQDNAMFNGTSSSLWAEGEVHVGGLSILIDDEEDVVMVLPHRDRTLVVT